MYQMGPDRTSSFLISSGIRLIFRLALLCVVVGSGRLVGQWRRTACQPPLHIARRHVH